MAGNERRGQLATIVACLITLAWSISFTLDLLVKTYDPPPSVTPLMLAVAGYLFGGEVMAKVTKRPDEAESNG